MPYQSQNTTNRPLRVFLCHSSNDKPAVRELYQKLRAEPWIEPWLDEEELYPGQDWNMEIEKAVEAADAIIVCLSKGSITKEGYIQRELRIVLDYADYKPEGTLYIMPVRLEECEPPRRLRAWQYADYFEGQRERALERLLVSLKRRADSLDLKIEDPVSQKEIKKIEKEQKDNQKYLDGISKKYSGKLEDLINNKPVTKTPKSAKTISSQLETPEQDETPVWLRSVAENFSVSVRPEEIVTDPNKITLSNGMEFMRVPAGKFVMGSNNADSNTKPRHMVEIPYDYWIARYVTTNELYNDFVKSQGIKHPVDGWDMKKDHPVVFVNWNNAMEYCQWLNIVLKGELPLGMLLRLPTEAEWEKAARGTTGLNFPWGKTFNKKKCNTQENFKFGTTPVGLYSPHGDSPYGCADMAGNVWEWTHSLKKEYPYDVNDGREDALAFGIHVRRGGAYTLFEGQAYCDYRHDRDTGILKDVGFRICLAPPLPK